MRYSTMRLAGLARAVPALLVLLPPIAPAQTPVEEVTVCELFTAPDRYSGKAIRVHGELRTDRHGFALAGIDCLPALVQKWKPTPLAIDLRQASEADTKLKGALPLDADSIKRMEAMLCFLHEHTAQDLHIGISGVFEGLFRFGEVFKTPNPAVPPIRRGYGHLAGYPAQLLYFSVRELVIRNPPRAADMDK